MAPLPRGLIALALLCSLARAQNVEVEEFTLDNGMKFLLLPRYEEPNTISVGWVAKVGSVNERPGITGISHFFEHMMFKGTTTVGTRDPVLDAEFMDRQQAIKSQINALSWGGQYDRFLAGEIDDPWDPANDTAELIALRAELKQVMEEHGEHIVKNEFDSIYSAEGARGMNAFTTNDLTFYFIDLPSNKIELWAWMESDRLADSVFREFYSERDVVHEERRMRLESSPTGVLDEQFDAMFWQSSPYSWSVIGWPTDLNSYTREDFDAYFNIHYRPNNLVGVVVGDFQPDVAKELVTRYFGRIPRGETPPPPMVTLEMPQTGAKRLDGECDCQDQLEVRYHAVPFMHHDSYALEVLVEVLNTRTGRLYKGLVDGLEIASSARASQDTRKYGGAFSFSARTKGEATPADLEAAWYDIVATLQTEPVSDNELQKVKNRVAADSYRQLQSNNFLRLQLGFFEASRSWKFINEGPVAMAAVTAEDIMRVANEYLQPTNSSVATYRRRGDAEPVNELLAALAPEMQAQAKMMLAQIDEQLQTMASAEDMQGALNGIIQQLQSQAGMVPDNVKPMFDYVVQELNDRLAEIDTESEG